MRKYSWKNGINRLAWHNVAADLQFVKITIFVTRQVWSRFACESPGSQAEVWVGGGLLQGQGHSVPKGPFEGDQHYLYYIHHTLASGKNNKEGTQTHPSTENWVTDLLSMGLPIKTRPSFPLSQSLPLGSFHKRLMLIPQRADRMKTTVTENLPNWSHGHSLV